MSSTRRSTNPDVAHAPQKNLSAVHLRPINVSLTTASQAARILPPRERAAVLWLANVAVNSQRIQVCWQSRGLPDPLKSIGRITEAEISRRLGLPTLEIYRALTGHRSADLSAFTMVVEKMREEVEAVLPPLARTQDTATMQAAFQAAAEQRAISLVTAESRHGKTEVASRLWLKNLHRSIWLGAPSNSDEKAFVVSLATALGICTSGGVKKVQLIDKIKRGLCPGLIDVILIDEAHGLFPLDLRETRPARLELLRELCDQLGIGAVLLSTPQFSTNLQLARQHSTNWSPAQFMGRHQPYSLCEMHTIEELRAIVGVHAGEIEGAALNALVLFVMASDAYLSAGIAAIRRARARIGTTATITSADIAAATLATSAPASVVEMAEKAVPARRGKFRVTEARVA